MDYDTFVTEFPSQEVLDKFISKDAFLASFKRNFDKKGPLAVGMSDVEIARLVEAGAITQKKRRRKLVLMLEKFDVDPYYQRQVVSVVRNFLLDPLSQTARFLQYEKEVPSPIVIGEDGFLVWDNGKRHIMGEDAPDGDPLVTTLVQDLYRTVADDPFEWGKIGTLAVIESVLTFTPKPKEKKMIEPPASFEKGQWTFFE